MLPVNLTLYYSANLKLVGWYLVTVARLLVLQLRKPTGAQQLGVRDITTQTPGEAPVVSLRL